MKPGAPYVFVSYVSEDLALVDRLCRELIEAGLPVWQDKQRLLPGDIWKDEIRKAIASGAYFVACFSAASERREQSYMREELVQALDEVRLRPNNRAWFIPVKLSDCTVPEYSIGAGRFLSDIQTIHLGHEWDSGVRRLIAALDPAGDHQDPSAAHASRSLTVDALTLLLLPQDADYAAQRAALRRIPGVTQARLLFGRYDIAVETSAEDMQSLHEALESIQRSVGGGGSVLTIVYSDHAARQLSTAEIVELLSDNGIEVLAVHDATEPVLVLPPDVPQSLRRQAIRVLREHNLRVALR
jgi:hypothetical protein